MSLTNSASVHDVLPDEMTALLNRIAEGYSKDAYYSNEKNLLRFTKHNRFHHYHIIFVVPDVDKLRQEAKAGCDCSAS